MSGLKVLIFESDAAFAGELSGAFADLGCITRVLDDGQAGLEVAAAERPDLIVLSIELPRMNGFAVCNRLKKSPETSAIPLVIVSSEAPAETFEAHAKLRTRAQDYVHKPVGAFELIDRCRAFVALPEAPVGGVIIDDDIAIDDSAAVFVDESPGNHPVDDETDALADAAFDNIMVEEKGPPAPAPAPRNAGLPPAMLAYQRESLELYTSASRALPAVLAMPESVTVRGMMRPVKVNVSVLALPNAPIPFIVTLPVLVQFFA